MVNKKEITYSQPINNVMSILNFYHNSQLFKDQDKDGRTPLHLALEASKFQRAETLCFQKNVGMYCICSSLVMTLRVNFLCYVDSSIKDEGEKNCLHVAFQKNVAGNLIIKLLVR